MRHLNSGVSLEMFKTVVKRCAILGATMLGISGMASAQAPSAPAVPAGAVTHADIQTIPGWESCDVCAGIGANGPRASYSMVENQISPSLNGRSAKFDIGGRTPYADAIWWKQLGADNAKTNFQYDVDFYLTAPQYAQALEFDVNQ